jgi:hypothetical protein
MNRRGFFYRLGGLFGAATALGLGVAKTAAPHFRPRPRAHTNYGALSEQQLKVWSKSLWKEARNNSFLEKLTKR